MNFYLNFIRCLKTIGQGLQRSSLAFLFLLSIFGSLFFTSHLLAAEPQRGVWTTPPFDLSIPTIWTENYSSSKFNLKGIERVEVIDFITGEYSSNHTRSRFSVGGTDLGIPFTHQNKLYLLFGDTMLGSEDGRPMGGGYWRSNVLAISEDTDFTDGLDITDMITTPGDEIFAKEIISSKKIPGLEHTVIPTGGISVDGIIYTYFMSVNTWGDPGQWTINYCGLARSDDHGQYFKKVKSFRLQNSNFGQVFPLFVGDYIYLFGIGGGRFGQLYLARVKPADIENQNAYEYFTRLDDDQPIFHNNPAYAKSIVDSPVAEPSVFFNKYLGEFILTYLDEGKGEIVMRTSKEPWLAWSDKLTILSNKEFPGLYGGFTHEMLVENNGKSFYFILSMWDPIYNTILMRVELK